MASTTPPAGTTPVRSTGPVDVEALKRQADQKLRQRMSAKTWWREMSWRHLIAVIASIYAVFPLLFVLSAALNPGSTLTGSNQMFRHFSMENFQALADGAFWQWFTNSIVIAVVTAIGTVLMAAAASYAFSRFRFTGRRMGLTALLVIQMFPQMLAFVAVFLLVMALGDVFPVLGFNSTLTLIAVYWGGALGVNTFLIYGFFNTIPTELDEAAKLDGASHAQIYWGIIFRLVSPVLAVVGLLSFITSFGEYILASLILPGEHQMTLAVGMFRFVSDQFAARWGLFAAGAVIAALPVLVLFLFLQKYIVGGLTAGSVKG